MLKFNLYSSTGPLDDFLLKYEKLSATLGDEYNAILGPAQKLQADLLGIELQKLESDPVDRPNSFGPIETIRAELFRHNRTLCGAFLGVRDVAFRLSPDQSEEQRGILRVFTVVDAGDEGTAERFINHVQECFTVTLKHSDIRSVRARSFIEEGLLPVNLTDSFEQAAASALRDRTARSLALAIKSSGGLLVGDLVKQINGAEQDRLPRIREQLLAAGIVNADTVVLCSKNGQPVCRVASRAALDTMVEAGLRCPCGKPANEEKIEEALSITTLGHKLLDKSRWMTLVLVEGLLGVGVAPEHIFAEQQFGGDEIDCIALISGYVTLFELKDGEFSLGHAYSFNAKNGILRPDYSIVVTTERIANDAKVHFERRQKMERENSRRHYNEELSEPIFVEGIDDLPIRLSDLVTELAVKDARRTLGDVLPMASITPAALLRGWTQRD